MEDNCAHDKMQVFKGVSAMSEPRVLQKRGRKPKPADERMRDCAISLCFPPKDMPRIEVVASSTGSPLAVFMRKAILKEVVRLEKKAMKQAV